MTKPVHPIRKMQRDLWAVRSDPEKVERKIARHVKPLLDALDRSHNRKTLWSKAIEPDANCPDCKLLAAWRAKL